MKFICNLIMLMLVCFSILGCSKTQDEKELDIAVKNANKKSTQLIAIPECAKRDKDMKYLNGVGCTAAERKAWNDKQHEF